MFYDWLPPLWPSSKKAMMISPKQPQTTTSLECPYSYLRQIYGKYHWAPFLHKISPDLKNEDPPKYQWILEVMDAIHLCLMLVDDVSRSVPVPTYLSGKFNTNLYLDGQISDYSDFRKGKPAAHRIYGPSETANRAYYRVTQILNETVTRFPKLAPFLLQCLEEILHGQDLSLIWRRDGLNSFPTTAEERMAAYREMVSLKTGALIRLMGQLALEDKSKDRTLTILAYGPRL
jgi:geranylgeranyldiphosphate transferase